MQSIPVYPGYVCECTWKYRSISSNSCERRNVKRGELNSYRCLLLVEGFIKVMNGSVMTLKEDNRFLSVWLLIHSCILCHVELHCICLITVNFSYHATRIVYAIT